VLPDPLAGLRGPTSKGEGRRGERKGRKRGNGKRREVEGNLLCKFLDPPLI